ISSLILIVPDNCMFIYATSLYANVKRKIWRQAIPPCLSADRRACGRQGQVKQAVSLPKFL
ncbi:MAG: hypothetical protein DRH24_15340, partial [Deltaproteobacteria bacterium]